MSYKKYPNPFTYVYKLSKVFTTNVVISLDEDFSQFTFTDGVVLGVELVEAMESIAILWWIKIIQEVDLQTFTKIYSNYEFPII